AAEILAAEHAIDVDLFAEVRTARVAGAVLALVDVAEREVLVARRRGRARVIATRVTANVRNTAADSRIPAALLVGRRIRPGIETHVTRIAGVGRRATPPFAAVRIRIQRRVFVIPGRRTFVRLAALVLVEGARMRRLGAS